MPRKKINAKLEAKSLISKLESGLIYPNLDEQEQKVYKSWKKTMEYFNSITKKRNPINLSRKKYLIGELNSRIRVAKFAKKREYCEKHGHVPKSEHISAGQSKARVYGECERCGMGYKRSLNPREWDDFYKMMNTPMAI